MDIHGLVFWDLIVIEWDLMGYECSNIVMLMGFNEYVIQLLYWVGYYQCFTDDEWMFQIDGVI